MTWNNKKLEALRKTYADDQGGLMIDSHFEEIAGHIFGERGHRSAPFAGMPSFLDAPILQPGKDAIVGLQVAMIGHAHGSGCLEPQRMPFRPARLAYD